MSDIQHFMSTNPALTTVLIGGLCLLAVVIIFRSIKFLIKAVVILSIAAMGYHFIAPHLNQHQAHQTPQHSKNQTHIPSHRNH